MRTIIPISEAFKHFGGEGKYPTVSARRSFRSRIKKFIQHGIVQGNVDDRLVDVESLKKHLEFESNILENYITPPEFRKLFGYSKENSSAKIKGIFKVWEEDFSIDYVETQFPIYNSTLFISKSSVERFFENYISMDEVKSAVSKTNSGWQYTFKRFGIKPLTIGLKRFIKKSEFEKIKDSVGIGTDKLTSIIRFVDAYKHLGGKEKYPTVSTRSSLQARIRNLIRQGIVQGNEDEKLVDVESLKEHYDFESNITENYMSISKFHELLGTNKDTTSAEFKEIIIDLEARFLFDYVETEYPINKRTFFISKSSVERFLGSYISMDEVESVVNKSHSGWIKGFERLGITLLKIGHKRFVGKYEYEMILDDSSAIINQSNYYTLEESKQMLSVEHSRDHNAIEKDYDLKPSKVYGYWKYYKKDLVDALKIRQTELRKKYITLQEAKELAADKGFLFLGDYIETKPVDSLLRPFFKHKTNMYSKDTFNSWLKRRAESTDFFEVSMESEFDTFKYRLEIKGIDINELGPLTSETWLQFVSSKLRSTKANPQTIERYIYTYIYCTENLIDLVYSTKKREIYSITSNDINILFNEIPKRNSLVIYQYLKQVYNKFNAEKIKAFDFNRVNDPSKFDEEHQDKSIYEYEVYKKVYN